MNLVEPAKKIAPDKPAGSWKRIGMLTPSSNTVLEPYTTAMLEAYGERASVHFGRFRVKEISMSQASQTQFVEEPILQAANHLADADVDVIAWNGTSAGWLGFDKDETLCRTIASETGIPGTSSILALNEIIQSTGARTMGLVSPYLTEIQDRIIKNYKDFGVDVIADRRLEDRGNFSFAEYSPELIAGLVRDVATAKPDVIAIVCTNFRGAPVVSRLEEELGILILDSVTVTLWSAIRMAGFDPAEIKCWGRLFQEVS